MSLKNIKDKISRWLFKHIDDYVVKEHDWLLKNIEDNITRQRLKNIEGKVSKRVLEKQTIYQDNLEKE